jgi:hypothetical protein
VADGNRFEFHGDFKVYPQPPSYGFQGRFDPDKTDFQWASEGPVFTRIRTVRCSRPKRVGHPAAVGPDEEYKTRPISMQPDEPARR